MLQEVFVEKRGVSVENTRSADYRDKLRSARRQKRDSHEPKAKGAEGIIHGNANAEDVSRKAVREI